MLTQALMSSFYHSLFKKSIGILLGLFFLFLGQTALARTPNDPEFVSQTPFLDQIHAQEAWNYTVGSRKTVIAIIDTGADIWHNDLRENIWRNSREVEANGADDDGNGYIDDVNGWNFTEDNNDARTSVFDDTADREAVDHGTILAGLAGAAGDNGMNGAGLNWRTRIMPLRAMRNDGGGTYADVIEAVDYAVNNGAHIISMSFVGNERAPALEAALKRAYDRGVLVISAAGNDRRQGAGDLDANPRYPVCLDAGMSENWILGVSSVDGNDSLSAFADYGGCIDIVAPGEKIYSTLRYAPQYGFADEFGGPWQGTSFAVPLVAGTAGLIKSIHPEWGAAQIISVLLETADSIDAESPSLAGKMGRGRLNAGRAVARAASTVPAFVPLTYIYHSTSASIKRYNFFTQTDETAVASRGLNLKSFTVADFDGDGAEEVGALFKRAKIFYVRIWDRWGNVSREFPVAAERGGWEAKEIESTSDDGAIIAVRLFNSATKVSRFLRFNQNGDKTGELNSRRAVDRWNVLDSSKLLLAGVSRKRLKLEVVDWNGENIKTVSEGGVDEALNVAGGALWDKTGVQAVVIARRGRQAVSLVVDLSSESVFEESLGRVRPGVFWETAVLRPNSLGVSSLLVFNNNGGDFSVSNGRGKIFESLKLPALDSSVGFAVF